MSLARMLPSSSLIDASNSDITKLQQKIKEIRQKGKHNTQGQGFQEAFKYLIAFVSSGDDATKLLRQKIVGLIVVDENTIATNAVTLAKITNESRSSINKKLVSILGFKERAGSKIRQRVKDLDHSFLNRNWRIRIKEPSKSDSSLVPGISSVAETMQSSHHGMLTKTPLPSVFELVRCVSPTLCQTMMSELNYC